MAVEAPEGLQVPMAAPEVVRIDAEVCGTPAALWQPIEVILAKLRRGKASGGREDGGKAYGVEFEGSEGLLL